MIIFPVVFDEQRYSALIEDGRDYSLIFSWERCSQEIRPFNQKVLAEKESH